MANDDPGYVDVGGKYYPDNMSPFIAPSYPIGTDINGQPTTGYSPVAGSPGAYPANYGAQNPAQKTGGGGGGGGGAGAPAATTTATGGTGYDPSITLGQDGNVYGYIRAYDAASGGYTFKYQNFGPATDLAAVSTASGIPAGMLQPMITQQQTTINSLIASGQLNPLSPGGTMTQQQLQQSLDQITTAQKYNSAVSQQQSPTAGGPTYAQMGDTTANANTAFQYANQGTINNSALANANTTLANYANAQAGSGVNGMTNQQLGLQAGNMSNVTQYNQGVFNQGQSLVGGYTNQQAGQVASQYGDQASIAQGQNYNTASGVGGLTYGQLGLQNNDQQAVQNNAYNTNYNAASGVGGMSYGQLGLNNSNTTAGLTYNANANANAANAYTGMSNQGTQLAADNAGNALALTKDTYALGAGPGTGGQSRVAYEQGTTDITDPYDRTQALYNSANQAGDNQLKDLNRSYDTAAQEYNLGSADYTGGQTRQQYLQGTQDIQNPYDRSDAIYKAQNQGQQQALDTYKQTAAQQAATTNNSSRNLTGLGWAGIQRPTISGYQ